MKTQGFSRSFHKWSDSPFCLGLHPAGRRGLPVRDPHQGRLLTVILADAESSVALALRVVSISQAWSVVLEDMLATQEAALPSFSAASADAEIEAAYRRWPNVRDMVRAAAIIETAGV